ncbi:MAG: hypothetical protein LC749_15450, partial [Actinobacteria bacterium]|nr:hypothetical protein [Actinomycetota bacterium]
MLVVAALAGLTTAGAPAEAAFPGSNGKLFCQGPGDRTTENPDLADDFEIFSINADGSGRTLITNNGPRIDPGDPTSPFVNDTVPDISPDGKWLAFASNRTGGDEVWIKNSDGTGTETRLTFAPGADMPEGWSADGTKIYFNSARITGNTEIFAMNANGSDQTRLTSAPGLDANPRESPDGQKILFFSDRDTPPDAELYTMNPDGTGVTRLTYLPGYDSYGDWSPDGKKIVWSHTIAGGMFFVSKSDIFTMNADGTGITQLTDTPALSLNPLNLNPIWSPDGTRIAFDSFRDSPAPPAPRNREVYTMNATDGSDLRRVTNARGTDGRCDWQPILRPAVAGPPPVYPVPTPTPTAAKLKTSLTLKAKPKRDKRLPFRYGFSGTVKIPAGVAKAT